MIIYIDRSGELNAFFAQRTLQFLLEPVVDALAVERVSASEGFYHVSFLQIVQANRATLFVLFVRPVLLLPVLESRDCVDYISHLFSRRNGFSVLIHLLFFLLEHFLTEIWLVVLEVLTAGLEGEAMRIGLTLELLMHSH
jgi:hypothetical protein